MKILHITDIFAPVGGIESYIIKLLPLLEEAGHENVVVYRQKHSQTLTEKTRAIYVPLDDNVMLAKTIHRERPTIIYLHAVYDWVTILTAKPYAPTIAYAHGFASVCPGLGKFHRRNDTICKRPFGIGCISTIYWQRCASARRPDNVYRIIRNTKIYQDAYKQLDGIIVGSTYMCDLLVQNGFQKANIRILPPHFERPYPTVSALTQNSPEILFVGRLEAEKGVPYLLKAVAQLSIPYRLQIAGDGTLKQEYENLANKLGIADQVNFLGWLDDNALHKAYQRATLFVMTSIMPEPFGKVGIEAMAHSRPVVAFNVGGIPDWLFNNYNGLLVPPRDAQQLSIQIQNLLTNKDMAIQLGQNGRDFVGDNFMPEKHREQFLAILQTFLNT
ncbi:MAG: glycosyltransferase family 4 protein [Chloroflexi bacterium]|nr:glycosyltransferase family 4 protein [Chloroflexota bacterium]